MNFESILLVEDNETDAMLSLRAIRQSHVRCEVVHAEDGSEACKHLFENPHYSPSLILLDLKLPKVNGFEVLERVRGTERTKRLPVVIFSSSAAETDLKRAFDLHANSYVQKNVDPDLYEKQLGVVLHYWSSVNAKCPV
jgi:two-component system, response regulator